MAEYTVTYNIKTNTFNTIQQLTELARVAGKMHGVAEQIKKVTTAINNLNTACGGSSGKGIAIKIDISQAQKQIAALEAQVQRLRNSLAGGGRGTGAAAGRGAGSRSGRTGSTAAPRGRAGTPGTQPVAGYQSRTSYMRQPARPTTSRVIPRNIAYRNLGPAFIDSGSGALDMVKGMGIMYGISGMGALFGQAVSDYVDYNNIITTTKSILGTHDKKPNFAGRFAGMEKKIREIGMRTKFTAPEVAEASKFLAMAGLDINAINKAMNPITDIALISDSDLGETADVMTNIMTAYQMKPEQLREIADHLTMGFTMSNTTLLEMAESYKYFGSIASNMGVDFKETVAMLGILGDAGLKGSHAGTTMRQIMNNMLKPTKNQVAVWEQLGIDRMDSNGNLKSMIQLFTELAEKGAVKKAFEMFRVTAAQGAVSLISDQMGPKKMQAIMEALENDAGISEQLANAKINNLEGLWKQIQSSFTEAAMQALADFEPQVTNTMRQLITWLQSNEGRSFVRELTGSIFSLMKSVGELTATFVDMYRKFSPLINFWLKLQIILQAVIIPLRIVKGLFNFVLGGAAIAMRIGAVSRALVGLRTTLSSTGSWSAGGRAFINTMRGVATAAEQTAGTVMASGQTIYGANGKILGTFDVQGTPIAGKEGEGWINRRNFFEERLLKRPGSQAMVSWLRSNQAQYSNIMYNVANSSMSTANKQRLLLRFGKLNQDAFNIIQGIYDKNKPNQNNLLQARDSARKAYQKYATYKEQYGLKHNLTKGAAAHFQARMDAYRMQREQFYIRSAEWDAMNDARQMSGGGYTYSQRPTSRWQRVRQYTSNWWNNGNGKQIVSGVGSMLLGAGGAALGSAYGNGQYSSLIWGTLGGVAPMLASAGPIGWGIGILAAGLGVYYELERKEEKARVASAWLQHVGDEWRIQNGMFAGTSATDSENAFRLAYDTQLSLNDAMVIRNRLLGEELDKISGINAEESRKQAAEASEAIFDEASKYYSDLASGMWQGDKLIGVLQKFDDTRNFGDLYYSKEGYTQGRNYIDYLGNVRGTYVDTAWGKKYVAPRYMTDDDSGNAFQSLYTLGMKDAAVIDDIRTYGSTLEEAIKNNDVEKLRAGVDYLRAQSKSQYIDVPSQWNLDNFNLSLEEAKALSRSDKTLTGPFRDAVASQYGTAAKEWELKLNDLLLWKEAVDAKQYTPEAMAAYLRLHYNELGVPSMARWNPNDVKAIDMERGWDAIRQTYIDTPNTVHTPQGSYTYVVPARSNAENTLAEGQKFMEWYNTLDNIQKAASVQMYEYWNTRMEQTAQWLKDQSVALLSGQSETTGTPWWMLDFSSLSNPNGGMNWMQMFDGSDSSRWMFQNSLSRSPFNFATSPKSSVKVPMVIQPQFASSYMQQFTKPEEQKPQNTYHVSVDMHDVGRLHESEIAELKKQVYTMFVDTLKDVANGPIVIGVNA